MSEAVQEIILHQGSEVSRAQDFMPVFDISLAVQRKKAMSAFIGKIMNEGADYGVIPGTTKMTLLKPGAEKLSSFFGLSPEFIYDQVVEDWTGHEHNGEPFFFYRVKCRLSRNGRVIGEADGSCNSWESKYRYRNASRKCPKCGAEAIIAGKKEYGGGWLCFGKKGGCGAKFADDSRDIVGQEVGKVPNPDIADQVNTILKMAEKRALVAAVLIATNCSDSFTQDMEDFSEDTSHIDTGGHAHGTKAAAQAVAERKIREMQAQQEPPQDSGPPPDEPPPTRKKGDGDFFKTMLAGFSEIKEQIGDEVYYNILGRAGYEHANEFKSRAAAMECYKTMLAYKKAMEGERA